MHIQGITTAKGGRTLDIAIEFAGDVSALFWLYSDAVDCAKCSSLTNPDTDYVIVSADEGGRESRAAYRNGEQVL